MKAKQQLHMLLNQESFSWPLTCFRAFSRRTEEGQPLVLSAVRQAEQRIVADGKRNKVRPAPVLVPQQC